MLHLSQGTTNSVALTLAEKQTLTSPYYLMVFKCDQTKETFACVLTGTRKGNWTVVNITEKVSPLAANGEVRLEKRGYYSYDVYEQTSSTNTNTADLSVVTLLESGKAFVQYQTPNDTRYTLSPFTDKTP